MTAPAPAPVYPGTEIDQVHRLLETLGETSGEIANALRDFPGTRRCGRGCPVYRWLRLLGARVDSVHEGWVDLKSGSVIMPTAVLQFVHDFDQGWYPALEAK